MTIKAIVNKIISDAAQGHKKPEPPSYFRMISLINDFRDCYSYESCERIRKELIRIGTLTVIPLIWKLKSEHVNVQCNAAYVLGRLGPKAELAIFPLAMALRDSDSTVRACAAHALGKIGSLASAYGF